MDTPIRLPYGISNFAQLIENHYYYVDKTRYITALEREANPYQFFIRPRKFGKSLFLSMLSWYYDINSASRFEELFGKFYIGSHPTREKNSYLVMTFNFSGTDTHDEDTFRCSFSEIVQQSVIDFLDKYRDIFPNTQNLIREIKDKQSGIASLRMIYSAALLAGRKMFVIIDEYDHFANDLIAMGVDNMYKKQVRSNGIVRDFYETLKIGTSDVVGRIFITGISPVMIDDLTSGFNIASNLTGEERYNEMLGFTREEVDAIMDETGVDKGLISVNIENYYDGYKFHEDAPRRIYNPTMILYYLNQLILTGKEPRNVIDDNLKTDYGRLQRLTMNEKNRETLLQIIKDDGIYSEVQTKFSIDRLSDTEHFVSLLFYMGLLTIDKTEQGLTWLKVPNYSIRTVYWEYLTRLIAEINEGVRMDLSELQASVRELAYRGNAVPLLEYVSQNIFSRLSNRDLIAFDEKYIKVLLLSVLFQTKMYLPSSEREVDGGYIDIYLERSPHLPDIPYEWAIELKYVKESEKGRLPEVRRQALDQLERYGRSSQLTGKPGLKKAAWLFIGKNKYEIIND